LPVAWHNVVCACRQGKGNDACIHALHIYEHSVPLEQLREMSGPA